MTSFSSSFASAPQSKLVAVAIAVLSQVILMTCTQLIFRLIGVDKVSQIATGDITPLIEVMKERESSDATAEERLSLPVFFNK